MDQKPSLLASFSPGQTFVIGIVGGILVLCTIGFVILLNMFLGGETSTSKSGTVTQPSVAVGEPNAQPTQIVLNPVDKKIDHIIGAKNPKVTIVEFSDFECPFCKNFHQTMQQIIKNYGNDVAWVYRQFPLESLHRQAREEANATECAADQGKFWEFTDLIFARTPSNDGLDLTQLPVYAKEIGLNVSKFETCLANRTFDSKIQTQIDDGVKAGARGTPYSVIIGSDGQKSVINGAQPYASVEAQIQQML